MAKLARLLSENCNLFNGGKKCKWLYIYANCEYNMSVSVLCAWLCVCDCETCQHVLGKTKQNPKMCWKTKYNTR